MSWLSRYPQVTLRAAALPTAYGVNVKPQAILHLLDEGHDDILQIDFGHHRHGRSLEIAGGRRQESLVLTEEALWTPYGDPNGMRARMWGFKVGRVLPFALNTGVIRVTRQHQPPDDQMAELLESDEYRSAQRQDWHSRPLHMISDQDVLTALLASEEFAHVPLRVLMRGKDIVQYFGPYGYTLARAPRPSGRAPTGIHSFARGEALALDEKEPKRRSARNYLYDLYVELSPYTLTARKYRRGAVGAFAMDGAPFTGRVRIPGAGLLVRAARRPPDRRPRRPRSADEAAISGGRRG